MSDRHGSAWSDGSDQGTGPDPLVARLQAMSPVSGVAVDFDAVAAEVGRRRSRRRAARAGLGIGVVAAGFVLLSTSGLLRLGWGGSSASSAAGAGAVSVASAPQSVNDLSGGPVTPEARSSGDATTGTTADPAQLCPDSVPTDPGLPPAPTGVWHSPFQPAQQLAPVETPVSAIVCRYRLVSFAADGPGIPTTPAQSTHPLFTAQRITAGLADLARDLSAMAATGTTTPRPCTAMAGPVDLLLLRLDYASGAVVWVQTKTDVNRCAPATNGRLTTDIYLGDSIEGAEQTSRWLPLSPDRFGVPTLPPTP